MTAKSGPDLANMARENDIEAEMAREKDDGRRKPKSGGAPKTSAPNRRPTWHEGAHTISSRRPQLRRGMEQGARFSEGASQEKFPAGE